MKKLSLFSLFYFIIFLSPVLGQSTPCLNFSDYYKPNQDPRIGSHIPVEQHIKALQTIKSYCDCIRIFASGSPLDTIPYLAKAMGFTTVIVGAWLDNNLTTNDAEIAAAIKLAKAGVVDRLVIGSEVRLRNQLSNAILIDYIEYVKQQVPNIPVAYADVYGIFLANPEILEAVDFVFLNIYPFWEGTHIDCTLYNFHNAYFSVKAIVDNKDVWVSESGWPSDGKTVGNAVPSLENLRYYLRNIRAWSKHHQVPIYYFEAFDEPWKFNTVNPQEAYWGLITYHSDTDSLVFKEGVQAILAGPMEIDTSVWACNFIPNSTSTPLVVVDSIPCYGDQNGILCGHVTGIRPCDYNLVLYIKVNGYWWIKPTYANPITRLSCDGSFCIDVVTGGLDRNATEYQLFLIDKNWSPPLIGNRLSLPDSLYANAIRYESVTRTPFNYGGIKILEPKSYVHQGDTQEVSFMVKDFQNILSCEAIVTAFQTSLTQVSSAQYEDYLDFQMIDSSKLAFTFSSITGDPISIADSTILFTVKVAVANEEEYCRSVQFAYPSSLNKIVHYVDQTAKSVQLLNLGNAFICPLVPLRLKMTEAEVVEPGDTVRIEVTTEDFRDIMAFSISLKANKDLKILEIDSVYLDSNYTVQIINEDSLTLSFNTGNNQRISRPDNAILFSFTVSTTDSIAACNFIRFSDEETSLTAVKLIYGEPKQVPVKAIDDLEICTQYNCQISLELEQEDVSCFGGNDGAAFVSILGAEPPISIQWSNGSTTSEVQNLAAGTYEIMFSDANGCIFSLEILIVEPDSIMVVIDVTPTTEGNSNGAINISVKGGVPPYDFEWYDTEGQISNEEDLSNLATGSYHCSIIDANGCQVMTDTIEVDISVGLLSPSAKLNLRITPNPTSGQARIISSSPLPESFCCSIQNIMGHIQTANIISGSPLCYTLDLSKYPAGLYFLRIEVDGTTTEIYPFVVIE